jgi:hypothetical protein
MGMGCEMKNVEERSMDSGSMLSILFLISLASFLVGFQQKRRWPNFEQKNPKGIQKYYATFPWFARDAFAFGGYGLIAVALFFFFCNVPLFGHAWK